MLAQATLFLTSGLPGIRVELDMDDPFLADYLSRIQPQPRDAANDLRRVVAAPTLVVHIRANDGQPLGTLTWSFGRVRWDEFVGDDPTFELLRWFETAANARRFVLPSGWRQVFEAPAPLTFTPIAGAPETRRQPLCSMAPPHWSNGPWIHDILGNNCYNYAANVGPSGDGVALPGKGTRMVISTASNVEDIRAGCAADRLTILEALPGNCPGPGHVIALVLRRSRLGGFHCLRLNRDRMWSHKDGPTRATNLDDQDRPITSIETAHFAFAFEFVGFFHCPPDHEVD